MWSLRSVPDCGNQPLGSSRRRDGFGGTGGKRKKKVFLFGLLFLGLLFVFMLVALNTLTAPPPRTSLCSRGRTPGAASMQNPFSVYPRACDVAINDLSLSLPRYRPHIHGPFLAAGAGAATESPPVPLHRTPRSLSHPSPVSQGTQRTGPSLPGWAQGTRGARGGRLVDAGGPM